VPLPVPDAVLRPGPDDPASLAWLWEHWGTTQAPRHVAEDTAVNQAGRERRLPRDAALAISFWSADWTPWRALARIAARWPALRFDPRMETPSHDRMTGEAVIWPSQVPRATVRRR
jgi:hypothetical protein